MKHSQKIQDEGYYYDINHHKIHKVRKPYHTIEFPSRVVKFDMENQWEICIKQGYSYEQQNHICRRCPYKRQCIVRLVKEDKVGKKNTRSIKHR